MLELLFLGFSTNLLLACILTITAYNAVSALVALIFAFVNATCIFFLMELEFIGLLFLIVYVGAVSVLFLFSVMLFNLKNIVRTKTTAFVLKNLIILLSIAVASLFLFQHFISLSPLVVTHDSLVMSNDSLAALANGPSSGSLVSRIRDMSTDRWVIVNTFSNNDIFFIGQILYGRFSLYLILASVILLIAMLGAVVLINNPKDHVQMQHALKQVTKSVRISLHGLRSSR
jgi:NADH:ubiquinone oxidoreductase subunit 6 (subunit J)